jgi:hypothetical protein
MHARRQTEQEIEHPLLGDRMGPRATDRLFRRPRLLPPPEEQKDVKIAIGAARASRSAAI